MPGVFAAYPQKAHYRYDYSAFAFCRRLHQAAAQISLALRSPDKPEFSAQPEMRPTAYGYH
jgi:hypothetical protein